VQQNTFSKRDIFLITGLVILTAQDASAYLDPGTGTMILQGIVAALVGGFMAIKMGWFRIRALLPGSGKKKSTDSTDSSINS
jgi:hypothetical protein